MKTLTLIASLFIASSSFAACASAFTDHDWQGTWAYGTTQHRETGQVTHAHFGSNNTLSVNYTMPNSTSLETATLKYACEASSPYTATLTGTARGATLDKTKAILMNDNHLIVYGYALYSGKTLLISAYLQSKT
ncbi:MAG: hypothetical protein COV52_03630 [Gammaproteobacteria bacterium CG11_big_fil_rev_8_21_14_0_20_46_22]|nr:MAG: hypothetical protein COW05_05290 [Gammaproteobacteria bacterium CG12_big_fil_rev_8_21_14_0_65_46_12]PIR11497.1 MAG: hypothetical protein COV52_03630 [Gammaproteobacteria bacterium CG11_big_fil_rev_8_21_14_0_20_46_22]